MAGQIEGAANTLRPTDTLLSTKSDNPWTLDTRMRDWQLTPKPPLERNTDNPKPGTESAPARAAVYGDKRAFAQDLEKYFGPMDANRDSVVNEGELKNFAEHASDEKGRALAAFLQQHLSDFKQISGQAKPQSGDLNKEQFAKAFAGMKASDALSRGDVETISLLAHQEAFDQQMKDYEKAERAAGWTHALSAVAYGAAAFLIYKFADRPLSLYTKFAIYAASPMNVLVEGLRASDSFSHKGSHDLHTEYARRQKMFESYLSGKPLEEANDSSPSSANSQSSDLNLTDSKPDTVLGVDLKRK